MTRNFILRTLFLVSLVVLSSTTSHPAASNAEEGKKQLHIPAMVPDAQPARSTEVPGMRIPEDGIKTNSHKIHLMKIDELGRIHRFHKERVRKIKKHHGKIWVVINILLICCHIALLVHAFMHVTH